MKWVILWPASLVFTIIAMLLAPVLPTFASKDGWLPAWLSVFQTPDNPLDGDSGFINEHAPFKGVQVGWKQYINRIFWLWRNPAYGADISWFGARLKKGDVVFYDGNLNTSDQGQPGYFLGMCGNYWDLYYVLKYGNSGYCLRFRAGWKLQRYAQNPQELQENNATAQITLRIMPWASYTGK